MNIKNLNIYRLQIKTGIMNKVCKIFTSKVKNTDKPEFKLHLIYRISDAGYPKKKLKNITNENCLKNAVSAFSLKKVDWHIICDNCSEKTLKMIKKYIPESHMQIVSIGHGAGTFNLAFDKALTFNDTDVVYFLENDYLHKENAFDVLKDGFDLGCSENDYVTLYDHPDKYNQTHPLFYYMQKHTHVFLGKVTHWKSAFSTTMTFAARVSTLKVDEKIWRKWTVTRHPFDYQIFCELMQKGKSLISPLPGVSTHGEVDGLSPLTNWEKVK